MIEVLELRYTQAELAQVPEKERLFYLMGTGLTNDLMTLLKLCAAAHRAVDEKREDRIATQGSVTVHMLLLRLLAGRIWEGWRLIARDYGPIEKLYEEVLNDKAKQALVELRSYFSKRRNLIATVRDKIGFHADKDIWKGAFNRIPSDVILGDYLAINAPNTLYYSAETIHQVAILDWTGADDLQVAVSTVIEDVQKQTFHIATFVYGFVEEFMDRHLKRQLDEMKSS
ncbi:MAG: hypothetical protein ACMG5Z_04195 [Luteimonas sp.]